MEHVQKRSNPKKLKTSLSPKIHKREKKQTVSNLKAGISRNVWGVRALDPPNLRL